MCSQNYWNKFLQSKLLVSGEHLYNDKSGKNNFVTRLDPRIKIKNRKKNKKQKGKYHNANYKIMKLNQATCSKKTLKCFTPSYTHLVYQGVTIVWKIGAFCFLKTIALILLFTGDLKHINLSQILKAQPRN